MVVNCCCADFCRKSSAKEESAQGKNVQKGVKKWGYGDESESDNDKAVCKTIGFAQKNHRFFGEKA